MLAAILLNLPRAEASGPFHGFAPGGKSGKAAAGTSWNKDWATDYGPDVDKARKARPTEVTKALEALNQAESLPELFDEAREIAEKRSLASDLMKDDFSLVLVMTAYYHLYQWMEKDRFLIP